MRRRFWMRFVLITGIVLNQYSISYAGKLISGSDAHQESGAELWVDNCSRCHNYRSPTEYTPNQWNTIMLHMRFQGGLTGQEAQKILDYLTESSISEFKSATTSSSSQQNGEANQSSKTTIKNGQSKPSGKLIYEKNCTGCHGSDGKGTGPSFPDFTKKGGVLSQPSNVLLNNIIHGIGGMPPKGGNPSLSNDDIKAALNYVKSTFAS